jgi:hypothetical protein
MKDLGEWRNVGRPQHPITESGMQPAHLNVPKLENAPCGSLLGLCLVVPLAQPLKIKSNQKFGRNLRSRSVLLLSNFTNNSTDVLERTDSASLKHQTNTFKEFRS